MNNNNNNNNNKFNKFNSGKSIEPSGDDEVIYGGGICVIRTNDVKHTIEPIGGGEVKSFSIGPCGHCVHQMNDSIPCGFCVGIDGANPIGGIEQIGGGEVKPNKFQS